MINSPRGPQSFFFWDYPQLALLLCRDARSLGCCYGNCLCSGPFCYWFRDDYRWCLRDLSCFVFFSSRLDRHVLRKNSKYQLAASICWLPSDCFSPPRGTMCEKPIFCIRSNLFHVFVIKNVFIVRRDFLLLLSSSRRTDFKFYSRWSRFFMHFLVGYP
jgi:hypothetical protein